MTASKKIATGQVVTMHYKLALDSGEVIDSSEGADPLAYLHGSGQIVQGLEHALEGRAVGDAFDVTVSPEEGYGVRNDEAVQVVPRGVFPADADLQEGIQFQATNQDEQPVIGTIRGLEDDKVTVDFNHPLAGETLHFSIEVVGTREATQEEADHGHAHGQGGHQHE